MLAQASLYFIRWGQTYVILTLRLDTQKLLNVFLFHRDSIKFIIQQKKKHFDKNFGVAFAIWDLMFGSLAFSEKATHRFGLRTEFGFNQGIMHLYIEPFKVAVKIFQRSKKRKHQSDYGRKINEHTS